MLLPRQTRNRLRVALGTCLAYAVIAGAIAAAWPHENKGFASSFVWWLLAIPGGLIAYVGLELFGTWSLGLPFWQRMSSWARVLLLVVLICSGAVGAIVVSRHFGA
jgi:hypothetical protein